MAVYFTGHYDTTLFALHCFQMSRTFFSKGLQCLELVNSTLMSIEQKCRLLQCLLYVLCIESWFIVLLAVCFILFVLH